jgi:hypothetical protein
MKAMAIEFHFTPELHLRDGRVIRHLDHAIIFAREHELRPGVDQRDEILHAMELPRRAKKRTPPRIGFCAGWRSCKSSNNRHRSRGRPVPWIT